MNQLLVDNSNTRTKMALVSPAGIGEMRMINTADITVESVQELLQNWDYERVCVASVVPRAASMIAEACCHVDVEFLTPEVPSNVDFSYYKGIETLGADRVANIVAAVQDSALPVVAVDAGTATTFDVAVRLNGKACFVGGVIAPGLKSFSECLHLRTALLPSAPLDMAGPAIGRSTLGALSSAVTLGYPAMMDGILRGIEAELGEEIHVVLTGGDASLLAPMLSRACRMEPMLTFKGLARAFGI